ncbi:MAG: GGDEF domain-containing protein [Pseudomonadales bacterium]
MSALPWRILAQLEIASLERQPNGEFSMVGEAPAWLQAVDSSFSQDGWRRADLHPVLGHFMAEANDFWSKGVARRRRSIAWKEDVSNGELYLQATTLLVGNRELLLIERISKARAESAADLELGDEAAAYSAAVQGSAIRQNLASFQLALSDPLTALFNREGFEKLANEQLAQAQRDKQSLLLLIIEMDNFKAINVTLGHHMGDLALQRTASALRTVFRQTDIIGRLGGNELAVLAHCNQQSHYEIILERLRAELVNLNSQDDMAFPLAVSIGSAWSSVDPTCTLTSLMIEADARVYEEKRKNQGGKRRSSDKASPTT